MSYYITKRIVEMFLKTLKDDKAAGRTVVAYEWHAILEGIHALDEGEPYDKWMKQVRRHGLVYDHSKVIDFEGIQLKRVVFKHPSKMAVKWMDPLAMATGYWKLDYDWVIFIADHRDGSDLN